MLQLINEIRYTRFYIKGKKFYRPVLCTNQRWYALNGVKRTATGAMNYGRKVTERYQKWCEIALVKNETEKIQQ